MTVPITVSEAALGAKIVIAAPDGTKIRVSVPAGSQDGTELKISGKGAAEREGLGQRRAAHYVPCGNPQAHD